MGTCPVIAVTDFSALTTIANQIAIEAKPSKTTVSNAAKSSFGVEIGIANERPRQCRSYGNVAMPAKFSFCVLQNNALCLTHCGCLQVHSRGIFLVVLVEMYVGLLAGTIVSFFAVRLFTNGFGSQITCFPSNGAEPPNNHFKLKRGSMTPATTISSNISDLLDRIAAQLSQNVLERTVRGY